MDRLGATFARYTGLAGLPHFNEDLESDPPTGVVDVRRAISTADAVVIASPTYNYSIPGGLKDLIDWCSRPIGQSAFAAKPVAIISASTGGGAGIDGSLYIGKILLRLGAVITEPQANIAKVTSASVESASFHKPVTGTLNATVQSLVLRSRGATVIDNAPLNRFELHLDGLVAGYADYQHYQRGDFTVLDLPHTVTEPQFRGQGIASVLVRGALDIVAAADQQVIPTCPFVADFIEKYPKYKPLSPDTAQ